MRYRGADRRPAQARAGSLPSDARSFLRHFHVNYVSVRDGGSGTYDDYGLTGLPETYFLDSRGRIVGHIVGEISRSELEGGIANAIRSGT